MTESQTQTVSISGTAAHKVLELLDREVSASPEEHEGKQYALRVAVQPGGCAGLRYALYFDDRKMDDDHVVSVEGLEIRVDKMSAPYLSGATIDYVDGLQQSGFTIDNPNAKGTCACGDSAQF
jgi:iron-sulfur cluster assembly accessory protein